MQAGSRLRRHSPVHGLSRAMRVQAKQRRRGAPSAQVHTSVWDPDHRGERRVQSGRERDQGFEGAHADEAKSELKSAFT